MSLSAIRAGRAEVELGIKDKLKAGLERARKRLTDFASTARQIGGGFLGGALASGALFAAPIASASRLEESMNKFNVVFGKNAEAVKAWSDNFSKEVGRSKEQIASFMAQSQDLFVPLGFDSKSAEEMSRQVTALSIDLASFNNMADADTLRDLQAALTGSGEVMKKYGVIVSEAAVKSQLLSKSIDPKTANVQEKTMARLQLIMAGTTSAQGDAIRSSGSFANQVKKLSGEFDNLFAAIGSAVLPIVTQLTTGFVNSVASVAAFVSANQGLVSILGGVVGSFALFTGVVGGTLIAFSGGATVAAFAASTLSTIIGGLSVAFAAVASPIGLVVAAVVGGTAAFLTFTKTGQAVVEWFSTNFATLKTIVSDSFAGMSDAMQAGNLGLAAKIAFTGVKLAIVSVMESVLKIFGSSMQEMFQVLADLYKRIGTLIAKLNTVRQQATNSIATGLASVFTSEQTQGNLQQDNAFHLGKANAFLDRMENLDTSKLGEGLNDAFNVEGLTDELKELTTQAASARVAVEEARKFPVVADLSGIAAEVEKAGQKFTASGTFSGNAAARLSGTNQLEANTEEMKKYLRNMWQEMRKGQGLLFS